MSQVTHLTLLFAALLISLVLTPLAKLVGPRLSAMDMPNPLSIHSSPTPRTGGLGVLAGVGLAVALAVAASPGVGAHDKTTLLGLLIAGIMVALIGLLDDMGRIPTWVEVSTLLLPPLLVVLLGLRVGFLPSPISVSPSPSSTWWGAHPP